MILRVTLPYLLLAYSARAALEKYPNDFNSSILVFKSGLYVSPRDGRYMVTNINYQDSEQHDAFHPVVGDQLVQANNHLISSLSFQEILSNNEGTYVLPIVSESGSKGHKISRFAKIEIFDAHSLTFRPTEGKRIHMRKVNT